MSHWNDSYAYSGQYQGSDAWNGDLDAQSMGQPYRDQPQYSSNNQYVSFNQFLSQMQNASTSQAGMTNSQHHNMSNNQYNYQPNMASNSRETVQDSYFPSNSNVAQDTHYHTLYQAKALPGTSTNDIVLKSNLTPTATEFVPKSSGVKQSSSQANVQTEFLEPNESKGSKGNHGRSSDRNWRERPQSITNESRFNNDNERQESRQDNRYNENSQDFNGRTSDSYSRNHEPSHRNNDSNGRNYEPRNNNDNNRNYSSGSRNYENNRKSEPGSRMYENNSKKYDSGSRKSNAGRNYDSNSKNFESSSRDTDSNGRNNENHSAEDKHDQRSLSKSSKSKNKDAALTFYNSSISKQDVRNGREGPSSSRVRNYAGSQRVRPIDRDVMEDEQYAQSYMQYHDENGERSNERAERGCERPFRENTADKGRERVNHGDMADRLRNRENQYYNEREERDNNYRDRRGGKFRGRDNNYCNEIPDRFRGKDNNYHDTRTDRVRDRDNRYGEERERVREREYVASPARGKKTDHGANMDLTQRERLSEQLNKGTLECLVCCDRVKPSDSVWSCSNCYHVLHLHCIKKWANSSLVEGKWRCPACQNESYEVPTEYHCLCGAVKSPSYTRGAGDAHTCGMLCQRPRTCPHPCLLLCHPGPCPPCLASLNRNCGCGKESRTTVCSNKTPQVCSGVCGKLLACGVHKCTKNCHEGACGDCVEMVTQVCYCQLSLSRTVACTAETGGKSQWACGATCSRVLACGVHSCDAPCHALSCQPCKLLPANVTACPCGKTRLEAGKRTLCTDPIATCGSICAKPLACGPVGDKHFCKADCHQGDCPPCPDKTVLQCRCGHSSREVPCGDLKDAIHNVLCQKKCNKKLSCGRHRCHATCCAATTHRCGLVCGRQLSCQLHRCEEFCHTGRCAPCPRLSFTELTCECGAEVTLPPVRCGARPPACSATCRRARACGHEPHHACHPDECPPCVVLTTKACYGAHEERKTIPCSQEEFSCGMPCGKPLPCGRHNCIKTCHKGPCDVVGKCSQPCTEKRASCGHECSAPCHDGPCPTSAPCKRAVRSTCQCGRRNVERPCTDNARDLARILSVAAAAKMQEGGSIDITDMQRPTNMLKTLECDDECRVEARTRQMALALQIRNPDVSSKLAPRYTEHVRATAVKEPAFAQQVHDHLTQLVQRAKKSKQKTRSHSFPSMNWQKRQFIHELCEQFGCESVAYDAEPNRNVVATADREKSWLPAMSIMEVLARENGKRRVPGPVLRPASSAALGNSAPTGGGASSKSSGWATLTSTNAWAARSQRAAPSPAVSTTAQTPQQKIDYFDNPPE